MTRSTAGRLLGQGEKQRAPLGAPYPDGLRSKVALADHEVSSFIQLDDGAGVGLDLCFKGLVLLQLALWPTPKTAMWLLGGGVRAARKHRLSERPTCRFDGSL